MTVEIILSAVIVFQQIWFMRQIQVLLNKLMSRNYFEYETSKPLPQTPKEKPQLVPEDMSEMGVMEQFLVR